VAKLNWSVSTSTLSLVYSTYLGGSHTDGGDGIAVDSSGNAYVTGYATSTNFPILDPISQTVLEDGSSTTYSGATLAGHVNAFIAKISAGAKAATTTAITANAPNPSVVGQPVTFTFTVSPVPPGSGTPTGNVTVSDGVGDTCTGTVAAGSCAIGFATAGNKTVTASYGGDSNFLASTSASVTQQVTDFSISAWPTSQRALPGGSVDYTITLAPLGGFTGSVALSCGALPTGATCLIRPSSLSLEGWGHAESTATIRTPWSITKGTYTVTFTGTFGSGVPATGGLTHNASVTLVVQ
jgi:hypothetical protein